MMKLLVAAAALFVCVSGGELSAANYPDRPVTIVVPAAPGGTPDLTARALADVLTAKWGKSVIIENKAGVGSIGATTVAKASPDGHTLLMSTSGTLLSVALYRQPPIDLEKELIPVAYTADTPFVLIASPSLPVKSVKELIAYAKTKAGQLSYGTAGAGSLQHLAGEVFDSMAGTQMVPVPYRGTTPALNDLLTGRIHLMFMPLGSALPHIEAGNVRVLGVGTPKRIASAATIPAIAEDLPGFTVVSWQLVAATGGTPKEVLDQLNKDIYQAVSDPKVRDVMVKLDLIPQSPASIADNQAFVRAELTKWQPVLEKLGLVK
jgi:tripartite-type tricarboxylate transporter receptor subunit TctC